MVAEKRLCKNCGEEFRVTFDDVAFCRKIGVPVAAWCADCCRQRRLAFRNERSLYKRKDSKTGKDIIAMYSGDKPFKVYDSKVWWGDGWDPEEHGRDYDFSRPFFDQFRELMEAVPWPALVNVNDVNSNYCNITTGNKNCYLVIGGDYNENCSYAQFNFHSKDSQDLYWVNKCELCYECIDCENCYKVSFSQYSRDCSDSAFLYNCVGCQSCFGCVNLRKKSYCIFNKQYSKEEYEDKLRELGISSFSKLGALRDKFLEFRLKQPHRYAEIIKSVNCTGNNIHSAKNCKMSFDVYENAEDCKDVFLAGWSLKDVFNCNHLGHKVELAYDSAILADSSSRIFFSGVVLSSHDVLYSYNCFSSSYLFGCVGVRSKEYCILNKQYSKEAFHKLRERIIKQMDEVPYTDKKGRVYKFGGFWPVEISPFAYNETVAQEYYPLTKEEALEEGYGWKDSGGKSYDVALQAGGLPDDIKDVNDDILGKVIGCAHARATSNEQPVTSNCNHKCTTAFKLVPQELEFYRRMNVPLPRLCPNCRHYQRLGQRSPLKLFSRKCQCAGGKSESGVYENIVDHFHGEGHCPNEFGTPYAPDRPEIVYCEKCYSAEVA